MNKIYYLPIKEQLDIPIFSHLETFVSIERKEKINTLHFDIDKKLSLYSEVLVRILIHQKLGLPNSEIVFEKNKYGKPYLKGYENFHFNISHTKNAIVVGVSEKAIGIDVEKIKGANLDIAKRFFIQNEYEYITDCKKNVDKRFYEIWTKKEAYIKYVGKGLSIPLNSFNVLNCDLSIKTLEIGEYIVSLCSSSKWFDVLKITEEILEKYYKL